MTDATEQRTTALEASHRELRQVLLIVCDLLETGNDVDAAEIAKHGGRFALANARRLQEPGQAGENEK